MAKVTEDFVTVHDSIRLRIIHYENETATNVPIVLVHGLASNALLWQSAAVALSNLGHPVIAVDLRGHGRSDKVSGGYDTDTVVSDLAHLLIAIKLKGFINPVVCGQSWGGNLVIQLAYKHPELIRGAVTVDGGFIDLQGQYTDWNACLQALRPPNLLGKPVESFRHYLNNAHSDWPLESIDGYMENFECLEDGTIRPWLSYDRHIEILRGLWEHRPADIYEDITVPVLFVPASGPNTLFPDTKTKEIEKAIRSIPRARVHWFESADHDLHAQYPNRFADLIHATISSELSESFF